MEVHHIELVASGDFAPSEELVIAVGDHLEATPGIVDPIVSADIRAGTIDIMVEIHDPSPIAARVLAARAFGAALVAAGAIDEWQIESERVRRAVLA